MMVLVGVRCGSVVLGCGRMMVIASRCRRVVSRFFVLLISRSMVGLVGVTLTRRAFTCFLKLMVILVRR